MTAVDALKVQMPCGKKCGRTAAFRFYGVPLCPKCGRKFYRRNRYALGLGPETTFDQL